MGKWAGIVGFDVDMDGLASLEPGFPGLDKVEISRATLVEQCKRLSNPLRYFDFWSLVRRPYHVVLRGPAAIICPSQFTRGVFLQISCLRGPHKPSANREKVA